MSFADDVSAEAARGATVRELGLSTEPEGDGLVGHATVVPEMWLPGTTTLRLSVLATWGDILCGVLAGAAYRPRIGLTLDLDAHLLAPIVGTGEVTGRASFVKTGRNVVITRAVFGRPGDDRPLAVVTGSFMASPNPDHVFSEDHVPGRIGRGGPLTRPLAERASITALGPGVAELPYRMENRNASDAIQGGMLTLVAEEAARSLAPGAGLGSLAIRYLKGFRSGAARATATRYGSIALIEITDTATGKLGASVTAHYAATEEGP